MFKGSMVAIVTPFKADGSFDEDTYRKLIDFQIESGTDAIIPCGTTGESATLDFAEHDRVIQVCIEQVAKRVPVIAGTGANSTAEAVTLSKNAKAMGADGLLLVCPYYNKPSQEGIYQHYKAIAAAVDLPQVLYNVPGRTGVNMAAETTVRLAEISNIVAIKEASGNLTQVSEILANAGDKIDVLSGDDFLTFPMLACGAKGVISVSANIVPGQVKAMVAAFFAGDHEKARRLHLELLDLHNAMFIDANPVPVKTSLSLMGKCDAKVRLPLWELSSTNLEKLKTVLRKHQLI
ncbi:4-hydroxy-tetrahydrodipicolinate synthase [Geoalkalibacter halelectricus]|uniref:4-hydroxy-tetrahydrodipicolinate synthase n=1 Tax=Geoalkalibacter halelectricus TaxID=2847045 RepID=A0ABY5ZSB7_9BACT|nr:4-hydroxy-tetrahydrodipicolinate synthase [Geoalkalibacter halelectricus]MDO3377456.1 4-hydroxy-tetrahydrodipicolinate synthase [Geoalkalibacter halelectricus]UWZ80785.1 4-hydroxy-tetrahydrodipicolinate synthase [Geoalkalibacter halelectricus]